MRLSENLQRLSDLIIGPYWGTYRIVYRVLQPLLECQMDVKLHTGTCHEELQWAPFPNTPRDWHIYP